MSIKLKGDGFHKKGRPKKKGMIQEGGIIPLYELWFIPHENSGKQFAPPPLLSRYAMC